MSFATTVALLLQIVIVTAMENDQTEIVGILEYSLSICEKYGVG